MIPPWRSECLRGETKQTMNLDEFEEDAQRIQLVFNKFTELRRKYRV